MCREVDIHCGAHPGVGFGHSQYPSDPHVGNDVGKVILSEAVRGFGHGTDEDSWRVGLEENGISSHIMVSCAAVKQEGLYEDTPEMGRR